MGNSCKFLFTGKNFLQHSHIHCENKWNFYEFDKACQKSFYILYTLLHFNKVVRAIYELSTVVIHKNKIMKKSWREIVIMEDTYGLN